MKKISLYVFLGLMFCNVSFGGILGDLLKKFEKTPPACMKGDCENGYGTYVFEDGNEYIGEWKDVKFHGQGTLTSTAGDKYVGGWKENEMYGLGTFTFATGDKYTGEFKDGKYHGQGTFLYSNGKIDKGIWKDDKLVESN
jgi:hypothetical protein